MHIKSATGGKKAVKNMEKCTYTMNGYVLGWHRR